MSHRIVLSLGSNVDRENSIRQAVARLGDLFDELRLSPTYESDAEGFDGEPFWNLAAVAETNLSPGQVDQALKKIESELGRVREGQPKFSDRTIDIDLVLYHDMVGSIDGIELPRDEIDRYPFVLKPIVDLIPDGLDPRTQQPLEERWREMASESPPMRQISIDLEPGGQALGIPATDGFELAATFFPGQGDLIIVNSATAVPRQFYRRFAIHAQTAGFAVLTWDYRGIGDSRPASLKGFIATMEDWVAKDMTGIINWAAKEHTEKRIAVVGHSAGGQLAGMLPNANRIDQMLTLSAQSGYWGLQAGSEPAKVRFMVTILIPLLCRLFGYLPWSKIGAGLDLPKGVALQWARWCRQPGYLLDDQSLPLDRYAKFNAPVLAYSVDDDDWGSAPAVDAMMSAYPKLERRHITAQAYGVEKFGHMGAFKAGSDRLWDEMLSCLGRSPRTEEEE